MSPTSSRGRPPVEPLHPVRSVRGAPGLLDFVLAEGRSTHRGPCPSGDFSRTERERGLGAHPLRPTHRWSAPKKFPLRGPGETGVADPGAQCTATHGSRRSHLPPLTPPPSRSDLDLATSRQGFDVFAPRGQSSVTTTDSLCRGKTGSPVHRRRRWREHASRLGKEAPTIAIDLWLPHGQLPCSHKTCAG